MTVITGRNGKGVAGHFGRQMRRDRLAHGWSITELAKHTGINGSHLGRIESGLRPPSVRVADALDKVFPERRGWYLQWLDDIRTAPEVPETFRSWGDYEDQSATLRLWTPQVVNGLFQTEDYARVLIGVSGATGEVAAARLGARIDRQRRVLGRCRVSYVLDQSALYRLAGSPQIMAAQLRHLLDVAAMPKVVLQVMPEVVHVVMEAGYALADDAVWSEHVVSGGVFTDPQIVGSVAARHDNLRGECMKVSESLALIGRLAEQWIGGNQPTRQVTAASASK
ncbi:MAG TPA: helix-turn-helix transcriptional regulator [Trebonia sp.]|jgi:transcriptional regulator with XRE-family HTH domain|nr:helix-turn-helix transcriptional regulator [Trebonia sp.]